jgi:tetratricopeptide (TPR) repeat protein
LACAVHVLTEIASNNPADYEAQRQALEANAHYIYYLDRIILYELGYLIVWYVDQVPEEQLMSEPLIAMQVAQQQQQDILSRAHEAGMNNPELDYYAGLAMGPTLPALPLLKKAVAADPQTLKGAAHALLAETYYALPDIAGGDLDLAVSTMRTALVKDPSNPRYARLLAAYLIDLGAVDEARSNLARMVGMETGSGGLQIMADQLRIAADLAERINDANLSRQLSGRRDGLLEEHPELLKRIVVSAMGHFGDKDPMEDS